MAGASALQTRYFTFGFGHAHAIGGFTYDKDIVVKITAEDPRAVLFEWFGTQWSMEYREQDLDMSYFPRGIKDLAAGAPRAGTAPGASDFCTCSHPLRGHFAFRSLSPHMPRPCLTEGCDCKDFQPADTDHQERAA